MRNPFPGNPVFERFLGLKDYFRRYTTRESVRRTKEIAKLARLISQTGDIISMDILGSVNFGMADDESDVDIVMYLACNHDEEITRKNTPMAVFYERLLLTTILHEITDRPYRIQVVDFINLTRLAKAIENQNYDDDVIARFVFYRTICRGVNKRVIRPYEKMIMQNPELFKKIETKLTEALLEFTRSYTHRRSFEKYLQRLETLEVSIPKSILEKVRDYLQVTWS
ncbi:MAG: hypothetical protein NZM25_02540 [Leptospiraceae bacterium]|nr:hypothetical protein [Leptospiraceae bacterium]MDW8307146.1 hypothetical protein [Leptospiraceae bacterium]